MQGSDSDVDLHCAKMSGVISPVDYCIEDTARLLETFKPDECIRLPFIYQDFPGVSFYLYLYPAGCSSAQRNYMSFYVEGVFDVAHQRQVDSGWLWKCGLYKAGHVVGAADFSYGPQYQGSIGAYTASLGDSGSGVRNAWKHDTIRSCIRSDGTLMVRLELWKNLFKITDLAERSLPLPQENLQDHLSDFKILANGKEYRVRRSILVESSPLMARMFDSKVKETNDNFLDLKNTVPGVAVEALLSALYHNRWGFLACIDLTIAVLDLSDKYEFQLAKSNCVASLMGMKNSDNVWDILVAADQFQAPMLKADCIEFISSNGLLDVDVLQSATWRKFKKNDATKDLARETMAGIIKEYDEMPKRRSNNRH